MRIDPIVIPKDMFLARDPVWAFKYVFYFIYFFSVLQYTSKKLLNDTQMNRTDIFSFL